MANKNPYGKSYFRRTQARTENKGFFGEMDYFINLSEVSGEDYILDIGCGTGSSMRYFKDKGFKNIYGIERSFYALKTYCQGFPVCNALSEKLPVKLSSMDFVFMSHVIGHVADVGNTIKEVRSSLRKRGKFGVITPRLFYRIVISVKNLFTNYKTDPTVLRYYSSKKLISDIEKHGFKLLSVQAIDFDPNGLIDRLVSKRLIAIFEAV